MDKVLVIGHGQVGRAIGRLCKEAGMRVSWIDVKGEVVVDDEFDVMHICFPQKDLSNFVFAVCSYLKRFKPELAIINSTVIPGTTRKIWNKFLDRQKVKIVHSPVQGQHKDLYYWLKKHTKWIGSLNDESATLTKKHFKKLGLKTRIVEKPEQTELAKLLDVTQYTLLIIWAQEAERICKKFNVEHLMVRNFGKEVQQFLEVRPDIYPSVAGGSCLIPDLKLLMSIWTSELFHFMIRSNEKKKQAERIKRKR